MSDASNGTNGYKLLLTLGFLSVGISTAVAYTNPATEYELSIYGGTPTLFWIGVGVALFLSLVTTFAAPVRRLRSVALCLAVVSFMNVILLPATRNWYYFAGGDALSHLGFTRELANGVFTMLNSLYPVLHTLVVFTSSITGTELHRSFLFVIPAYVLVFLVFVVLTARLFTRNRWVVGAATFSGLLLLPMNNISGDLTPQPSSQAMLYLPFVLYLLVNVMLYRDWRSAVLVSISAFCLILLHPLHGASLVLLITTIAVLQLAHSSLARPTTSIGSRPLYFQAVIVTISFWVWVQTTTAARFERNFRRMIASVFVDTETAETVQTRNVSLELLGGSLEEMFFKLFFIAAVYCGICGILMAISVVDVSFDRPRFIERVSEELLFESPTANVTLCFWTIGFAVTSVLFLIYVFGGISDQYFRHYGFLMGTVTIIGGLAVGQALRALSTRISVRKTAAVGVVFLGVCLLLTVPVIFPAPYMYQDSGHIPETEMHGHATAFEIRDEEIIHAALRRGAHRYEDAILRGDDPTRDFSAETEGVPDRFAERELTGEDDESQYYRNLRGYFDEPAYLFVKERDRTLETDLYQGFRWSADDFAYLEDEPGIARVQDNGGFTLYTIEPEESDRDD